MPENAEANVNVIELLLLYTISPNTTLLPLSTTVTDGNLLKVCVIFHVEDSEVCSKIAVVELNEALPSI